MLPTVLVIERGHFPEGIALEECERPETINGEQAIIRFQRRADAGVFEKIGRFFSDLMHGVRKAQGYLCVQHRLPTAFNIRGQWFQTPQQKTEIPTSFFADPIPNGAPQGKVIFKRIRVEVRDRAEDSPSGWDSAVTRRISEELHDRFGAYLARKEPQVRADPSPVQAFLDWQARRSATLTQQQLERLSAFKTAFNAFRDELDQHVRFRVEFALAQLGKQLDAQPQLQALADRAGWNGPPPPPAPAAPPPPPVLKPPASPDALASGRSKAAKPASTMAREGDAQDAMMAQLKEKLGKMRGKAEDAADTDKQAWDE